jgi:hypothetical protein
MLTRNQMLRLWRQRRYAALSDRILQNGRLPEPGKRAFLLSTRPIEVVALGLTLQRLTELLRGADTELPGMVDELLAHQQPHGGFGSLVATAIAVRALLDVLEGASRDEPAWRAATKAGLSWLAAHQRADGLFDDDLVVNEVVAWQLGASEAFIEGQGFEEFRAALPGRSIMGLGLQLEGLARATMIAA